MCQKRGMCRAIAVQGRVHYSKVSSLRYCGLQAEATAEDSQADSAQQVLEAVKVGAITAVGRLVAFSALPEASWLGPALLSRFVAHGKAVTDAVKDIARCGNVCMHHISHYNMPGLRASVALR